MRGKLMWQADEFQFTQPKRAATGVLNSFQILTSVSIHAAQAGCDLARTPIEVVRTCFNSRSPSGLRRIQGRGEQHLHRGFNSRSPSGLRPGFTARSLVSVVFQFTQPKRAATIDPLHTLVSY